MALIGTSSLYRSTLAFDSFKAASAFAIDALMLLRAAHKGAGSISNKTWPSLTFEPSSKRRLRRIPVARARTCASRIELIRPGSSVVRLTRSDDTVTKDTSTGGGAACFGSLFPHAPRRTANDSGPTRSNVVRKIDFIKNIGEIRPFGIRLRQTK